MKIQRQNKIQELISNENIRTQEELSRRLHGEGFQVTQATISRDIKELGLIKIATADDEYRYSLQGELNHQTTYFDRLKRLCKEVMISYDYSENIIVIKTLPGHAQALALSLDHAGWKEVIGTVAGDDTIFILIKPKDDVGKILLRLKEMV